MFAHIGTLIVTITMAIVLMVATGYATIANAKLIGTKEAKSSLNIATVTGWIGATIAIAYFGAMIIFAEEILAMPWLLSTSTIAFFFIDAILIFVGIMMAYAASKIKGNKSYNKNKSEYTYCVNGAFAGLIAGGIVAVVYIGMKVYDAMHDDGGGGGGGGDLSDVMDIVGGKGGSKLKIASTVGKLGFKYLSKI